MMFVVGWILVIISACAETPVILHIGECEHGIVYSENIDEAKKVFKEAEITDVLISGGCYRDKFVTNK